MFLETIQRVGKLNILIDTESDISLLPVEKKLNRKPDDFILYVANDTRVNTFSEKRLTLNFSLRRNFTWNFCVVDVLYPIIGADLLAHHLLVFGVRVADRSAPLTQVLSEFPEITGVAQFPDLKVRDVKH